MSFKYVTYFKLTNKVLDLDDANVYLSDDDHVKYLKGDSRVNDNISKAVDSIQYYLTDTQSGYIEVTTSRIMSEEELSEISTFISGYNADGLGEGFADQNFAYYTMRDPSNPTNGDLYDVIASFDWKTNDYKLELCSE